MVRQRKNLVNPLFAHHSYNKGINKGKKKGPSQLEDVDEDGCSHRVQRGWLGTLIAGGAVAAAVMVVLGVAYFLYLGYLETRVNTPLAAPKVVGGTRDGSNTDKARNMDRYWGTYRPGLYFGTRARHPTSPVTGLMWFTPGHYQNNMLAVRHWCDQADDLHSYGWQKHDGRNFGSQLIRDKYLTITTDFVKRTVASRIGGGTEEGGKHGGDWTARITAKPRSSASKGRLASLIYYVALDPDDPTADLQPFLGGAAGGAGVVMGESEATGGFRLHVFNMSGVTVHQHHLSMKHLGLDKLKESLFKGLRAFPSGDGTQKHVGLVGDLFHSEDLHREPNFVAFQVTGELPFTIEVLYESASFTQRPNMLFGKTFTKEFDKLSEKFDMKFDEKFPLREKGYNEEEINFAKAALSNMVGGIGYFYGRSKVQGEPNSEPVPYWKAALYTAVPSRSFFPRGFLWDEGFHNLLISKWDREISLDIVGHWLDLMNWDGWIPREQILGLEARARVPDEFVVQRSKNANPPTLLLTLHSMMSGFKEGVSDEDFEHMKLLWPRLRAWYAWFNTTQVGELPGTYRWRGRDANTNNELNPKTLTSGLDDYPRASHPTVDERHLDLRCWMTLASGLMADIATMLEKDPTKFKETYVYLSNNDLLDSLHWSYTEGGYMDYGLHTFDVELKKINPDTNAVRVTKSPPKYRFVDSAGYVSFFPLFLQILDPQSSKLSKVLDDLIRTDILWTQYGLRSLAKNSPLYMKYNTEHDPPYWRGPIWLNMNYLAVRALHYYSEQTGPYAEQARNIYTQLRHNLVRNLMSEYKRTGYLWEQYNDRTGQGQGCRPFTGWSALIVLIMAENY